MRSFTFFFCARRIIAAMTSVRRLSVAAVGGSRVRVFGSVSTGGEHEGSDIDLLIRAAPGIGLLEISRLELRLAELLGTGVDVVPDDSIRPSMRRRVLSEAALL